MEKIKAWFCIKENRSFLLRIVLTMALPLVCCILYCLLRGKWIGNVYLPCSEWNDELFYYKQVEGMIAYGFPQGYFGFNESHALKLSFAAWSPVLVFPWVIWGVLFGWNFLSPILCNLVLLTLAMGCFVLLTKPNWKQFGVMAVLFCLFTPFVRYLLSGMPEIICFSMLIIFYGFAIREVREHRNFSLIALFALGVIMTLMRPYFILFLFLPCFLAIRNHRKLGFVVSVIVLGTTALGYGLIKHYLGAEYFADLFFTDWIKAFFEKGLFGGMRYTLGKLYYMGKDMGIHVLEACRSGMASGAFFAGFLIMMGTLAWQTVLDLRDFLKKKKEGGKSRELLIVEANLLFSFVGMFFALLLMYKLTEGSKHLLTFLAAGIFVISMMNTKRYGKAMLIGVAFLYFYVIMARAPYDYQVPFVTAERKEQVEFWQDRMKGVLGIEEEKVPSFDNVVIWVLSDQIIDLNDGNQGDEAQNGAMVRKNSPWQLLYALPKGMGISCCKDDYVLDHLDHLNSKYLTTVCGGRIDQIMQEGNYQELIRDADMVLYKLK